MKCKNIILLIALLVMVNFASAIVWVGDANDVASWFVPGNWSTAAVPTGADNAVFNVDGASEALVAASGATCRVFKMGDGGTANGNFLRIADGGELVTAVDDWSAVGYNQPSTLIVEDGGYLQTGGRMGIGWFSEGGATGLTSTLTVGGEVLINGTFQVGTDGGAHPEHVAVVKLVGGGSVDVNGELNFLTGEGSSIDIEHGSLTFNGDLTAQINPLITSGEISGFATLSAYGASSTPTAVYADTRTTVTAPDPMNRVPAWGQPVKDGSLTLSWTNLPAQVGSDVYVEVWSGTDPNKLGPNYNKVSFGFANESNTFTSTTPGDYYWQVDSYLYGKPTTMGGTVDYSDPNFPIVEGTVIPFTSTDDTPPSVVYVTPPTATWAGEETLLTVNVKDDGKTDVTVVWSADDTSDSDAGPIVDPNVVFDPPFTVIPAQASYEGAGIEVSTNMTVDYHAAQMTATVAVDDPINPDADSAVLNLDCAEDACQAATAVLNWDDDHPADIALDCVIDLADFAQVALEWLTDYNLSGPVPIQ